jgi:chromosome segregation ATPase
MSNGMIKGNNSWTSSVSSDKNLRTELEVLQREVADMKNIHIRLDKAITKITDVSNSIHIMLAVHEEKIERQDEILSDNTSQIEAKRKELATDIKDLHSRITTINRELYDRITNTEQHIISENQKNIESLKVNLNDRVSILEKWRWLIIGGAVVVGFILNKFLQL